MIHNQISPIAAICNVAVPEVTINSYTEKLKGFSNILTFQSKNERTLVQHFIINFKFPVLEPILENFVEFFSTQNPSEPKKSLFGKVIPYAVSDSNNGISFSFIHKTDVGFQFPCGYLKKQDSREYEKRYFSTCPVPKLLDRYIQTLTLKLITKSTVYEYSTPILLVAYSMLKSSSHSNIFLTQRKKDLIDYLNEKIKNFTFKSYEIQNPIYSMPGDLACIQNRNNKRKIEVQRQPHEAPKRIKLNTEREEAIADMLSRQKNIPLPIEPDPLRLYSNDRIFPSESNSAHHYSNFGQSNWIYPTEAELPRIFPRESRIKFDP